MIYNIDGVGSETAFDVTGDGLSQAYDINGNPLFGSVLKIMTYNVQWFTGINSQQTMQNIIINGNNPDIIGIQEISKTGTVAAVGRNVLSGYTRKLSSHKNYIAFASKLPMSNYIIADFQNQDPVDLSQYNETRAYMVCDLSALGTTIKWINTHLCNNTESYRWLQMGEVLTMANGYIQSGYPVIITGDFNNKTLSFEGGDYLNLFKPFLDAGYHLANSIPDLGFTKTWTSGTTATSTSDLTYALDNIIVSPGLAINTIKFDTTKFDYLDGNSIDHIPIIIEVSISQ